jgi:hypothetical protein
VLLNALTSLLLTSAPAAAQNMALEPQNRLHVGLNMVGGPSPFGVTGGFDSRLTRYIALDIGAFVSPVPVASDYELDSVDTNAEYYELRHGVFATPGLRIPHPQPKHWAWEVFARAGGGVVWAANLSPNAPVDATRPAPGGLLGGDALVRFGKVGVRASGKAWLFDVLQTSPSEDFLLVRPQWSVEALVQW